MPEPPVNTVAAYLDQLTFTRLTITEQAEVLRILYATAPAKNFCDHLGEKLAARLTADWIGQGPLQEVFAVIDALHWHAGRVLSGSELAVLTKRLLQHEVSLGGPYYDVPGQVSLATNIYIANCMAWLAAPLPNLEQYICHTLGMQAAFDPLVLPGIARTYPALAEEYLAKYAHNPPSTMELLCNYYTACQTSSTPTSSAPVVTPSAVAMSPIMQALAIFAAHSPEIKSTGSATDSQLVQVIQIAETTYTNLPAVLSEPALQALQRLQAADSAHEITLLPHFFADAFYQTAQKAKAAMLSQLGAANIHSWLAYTIYDDFLDSEGRPLLLPVANVALRAATVAYQQILPDHAGFQQYVRQAFIAVDAANAHEIQHWRFTVSSQHITIGAIPNFADGQWLADRALLHILGPMAIVAGCGYQPSDKTWQAIVKSLRHYLIARQLTDDLHDWADDLQAGRFSYVVADILQSLSLTPGVYRLDKLLQGARQHFWRHHLPTLCRDISRHISRSRRGLQPYIGHQANQLFAFLDTLEASLKAALDKQQQSGEFLRELH